MSFDAIVLAGSRGGSDPVVAHAGVTDKALVEVGGRTMLHRVVLALRAAGAERILVVHSSLDVRAHALGLGCEVLAGESGPSASAAAALACLGAPALLTTADHPLLDPAWIAAFLAAIPADVDVAALLARRDVVEAAVPDTRRTWLRFADGDWSGCNLFHLATPRAAAALALWQSVERDRKRPWRIVRRLGPLLLLRYLLGRLTLVEAITRIAAVAGVRAAMVPSADGLAAVDVDKPADLDLVRRIIG